MEPKTIMVFDTKPILDKYEIQYEIKRGGFGLIYKGIDQQFGKDVAIKSIDPRFLNEAKFIDMFRKEAISTAQLNHPNIIQIYDIIKEETGQLYIIMEYIDGPDLRSLIRQSQLQKKRFPLHLGVFILSEICNGLDYAHSRRDPTTKTPLNLVHQDVSPVNIMLTRAGQVKLIDFGMANLKSNAPQNDKEVAVHGKIRYMAPEQLRGNDKIDHRADIFALGVNLYEMVTGRHFINVSDEGEVLETLMNGTWDLHLLNSQTIPDKLRDCICKALEFHPRNRYQTAKQMFRDLMHFMILTNPTADYLNELKTYIHSIFPDGEDNSQNSQVRSEAATFTTSHKAEQKIDMDEQQAVASDEQSQPIDDINDSPVEEVFDHPEDQPENSVPELSEDEHENLVEVEETNGASYYSFIDEVEEQDDQRTIIDVVRLSARTHKKGLAVGIITLLCSALLFIATDILAQFTPVGSSIYDFLFPPAIKITTVPAGARVYLDNALLNQKTPLSLDEIKPGVHKLMFTLSQYEPIVKSINVPGKGELKIAGEASRHASQPYIFKFKNRFEIKSKPPGADILIDGIKVNQTTPATLNWDVSENPTHIELEYAGMNRLSGLFINSLDNQEFIKDKRFWKVEKIVSGKANYAIEGIFHKKVTIRTRPSKVNIFIDDLPQPAGITGLNGTVVLTAGKHNITLKKDDYLDQIFVLSIDETTPDIIEKELMRMVRLFAKETGSSIERDLGAKITELSTNDQSVQINRKTPAILKLRPLPYTARVQLDGYEETLMEIPANVKSVVANMRPVNSLITIRAVDAITNKPLEAARIKIMIEHNRESGELLGITDRNGEITGQFPPGFYQVFIIKNGYQNQSKDLRIRAGNPTQSMTFRLSAL